VSGPNFKLNDDLRTITVTFLTTPLASMTLDVSEVEKFLKDLRHFRTLMHPEIPRQFAMGQKIDDAAADPNWATEPDALRGDSILHIRDPGFGWLHYLFPKKEARKLAKTLQVQVDAPPPGRSQGRPN
jgi:hypothetical protein